ncbi:unnamed protein product [Caenorhabditis sp. 36 PRJEB53466]|nr:unnamed protein product [Caenorhabditis sp. 36 PRJEB53466]
MNYYHTIVFISLILLIFKGRSERDRFFALGSEGNRLDPWTEATDPIGTVKAKRGVRYHPNYTIEVFAGTGATYPIGTGIWDTDSTTSTDGTIRRGGPGRSTGNVTDQQGYTINVEVHIRDPEPSTSTSTEPSGGPTGPGPGPEGTGTATTISSPATTLRGSTTRNSRTSTTSAGPRGTQVIKGGPVPGGTGNGGTGNTNPSGPGGPSGSNPSPGTKPKCKVVCEGDPDWDDTAPGPPPKPKPKPTKPGGTTTKSTKTTKTERTTTTPGSTSTSGSSTSTSESTSTSSSTRICTTSTGGTSSTSGTTGSTTWDPCISTSTSERTTTGTVTTTEGSTTTSGTSTPSDVSSTTSGTSSTTMSSSSTSTDSSSSTSMSTSSEAAPVAERLQSLKTCKRNYDDMECPGFCDELGAASKSAEQGIHVAPPEPYNWIWIIFLSVLLFIIYTCNVILGTMNGVLDYDRRKAKKRAEATEEDLEDRDQNEKLKPKKKIKSKSKSPVRKPEKPVEKATKDQKTKKKPTEPLKKTKTTDAKAKKAKKSLEIPEMPRESIRLTKKSKPAKTAAGKKNKKMNLLHRKQDLRTIVIIVYLLASTADLWEGDRKIDGDRSGPAGKSKRGIGYHPNYTIEVFSGAGVTYPIGTGSWDTDSTTSTLGTIGKEGPESPTSRPGYTIDVDVHIRDPNGTTTVIPPVLGTESASTDGTIGKDGPESSISRPGYTIDVDVLIRDPNGTANPGTSPGPIGNPNSQGSSTSTTVIPPVLGTGSASTDGTIGREGPESPTSGPGYTIDVDVHIRDPNVHGPNTSTTSESPGYTIDVSVNIGPNDTLPTAGTTVPEGSGPGDTAKPPFLLPGSSTTQPGTRTLEARITTGSTLEGSSTTYCPPWTTTSSAFSSSSTDSYSGSSTESTSGTTPIGCIPIVNAPIPREPLGPPLNVNTTTTIPSLMTSGPSGPSTVTVNRTPKYFYIEKFTNNSIHYNTEDDKQIGRINIENINIRFKFFY